MCKSIQKPSYSVYRAKMKKTMDLRLSNTSNFDNGVIQLRSIISNISTEIMSNTFKMAKHCQTDFKSQICPRSMDKPTLKAVPISETPRNDIQRPLKTIHPIKSIKIVNNNKRFKRQKSWFLSQSTKSEIKHL